MKAETGERCWECVSRTGSTGQEAKGVTEGRKEQEWPPRIERGRCAALTHLKLEGGWVVVVVCVWKGREGLGSRKFVTLCIFPKKVNS